MTHGSPKISIGSQACATFAFRVVQALLEVLMTMLLARFLVSEEYGAWTVAWSCMMLVAIPAQFGLPQLIVRESSRGMSSGHFSVVKGLHRAACSVGAGIGFPVVGIAMLLVAWLRPPEDIPLFGIAMLSIPFVILSNLRQAFMRGVRRPVSGQFSEYLVQPVVRIALLLLLKMEQPDLTAQTAMLAVTGSWMISAMTGEILRRWRQPKELSGVTAVYRWCYWGKEALPFMMVGGLQAANQRLDVLMLDIMGFGHQAGIYQVSLTLTRLSNFFLTAVNAVMGTYLVDYMTRNDKAGMQTLLDKYYSRMFYCAAVFILSMMLSSHWLLLGAYGKEYLQAQWPLIILLLGQTVNIACGCDMLLLNMAGYQKKSARTVVYSLFINLGCNVLFIPVLGILGAAIATSASTISWNVITVRDVRKYCGVNPVTVGVLFH